MGVSRNNDVHCTCGRCGAHDPQAAAYGEECGGTPGELAIGFPNRPSPGLHPRSSLRHYPTASCGTCPPIPPKRYIYEFRQLGSAVLTSSLKYISDKQERPSIIASATLGHARMVSGNYLWHNRPPSGSRLSACRGGEWSCLMTERPAYLKREDTHETDVTR